VSRLVDKLVLMQHAVVLVSGIDRKYDMCNNPKNYK